MKYATDISDMVAISDLRKRFGEIEKRLPFIENITLTKRGKPFAILKAAPSVKRAMMRKAAGRLKGTSIDHDAFWNEVLRQKSKTEDIVL